MTVNKPVVIVGGAGAMGRHAARALAHLASDVSIVIADLNIEAGQRLADELGDAATAVYLDVTNDEMMHELFSECGIVLNTMGPFAQFGTPILKAALDNGCHYLDIDDDWQSTVEALSFDAYAKSQNCTVVIGLGASPGTTNLCARMAAEHLDTVDELYTGWSLASAVVEPEDRYPTSGPAAAAQHWLHQCSSPVQAWDNHQVANIAPLEEVRFDYPGIGPTFAYTMGHPEPVTLPLKYPNLRRSINLQCGPRELFAELQDLVAGVKRGQLTPSQAATAIDSHERTPVTPTQDTSLPDIWALAIGTKANVPTAIAIHPTKDLPGKMGGHTGIPLAIGSAMVLNGTLDHPGVHAPEAAIDPGVFFAHYAVMCNTTPEELLSTTEQSSPNPVSLR